MNGRAVFTFSATEAPKLIDATLAKAGIGRGDIDLYLVHQGSRYIVDTIRGRLGVEEEKVPVAIRDYGNTVSSSIPMMLRDYLITRTYQKSYYVGLV